MSLLSWTTVSILLALSESCEDLSRDCVYRQELCNSPVNADRTLVQAACPYSCNVCTRKRAKHPPVQCRDAVLDCYERRELCTRPSYQRMMRRQCSLTCGFCVPDGENTQVIKSSSSFEESTEDFASRKRRIMRKLEKSGVTVEELRSLIRQQATTQATTTVTTTTDTTCLDRAVDCADKIGLCSHRSYKSLVERMCRRTCNLCG